MKNIDRMQLLKEMGIRYYEARKLKGLTQEAAAEIADLRNKQYQTLNLGKAFYLQILCLDFAPLIILVAITY